MSWNLQGLRCRASRRFGPCTLPIAVSIPQAEGLSSSPRPRRAAWERPAPCEVLLGAAFFFLGLQETLRLSPMLPVPA